MRIRRTDTGGFTLIELLVVIAIIAILAAILFPVFVKAKDAGKAAKCLYQMKEIGSAVSMYAGDWGDRTPLHFSYYFKTDETDPHRLHISYYDVLPPYFKKRWGSFVCPTDPLGCVAWEQWRMVKDGLLPNTPKSYASITGYGTWLYPRNASDGEPANWEFPTINEMARKPSRMAYMWDGFYDFVDSPVQLYPGDGKYDDKHRLSARHNDGINCLFYDWHAKWMKHTMITPEWLGWE